MCYQVWFVEDVELPGEVDFAFVRQPGETRLFVKRSAIEAVSGRCDVLSRAWETWQAAEHRPQERRQFAAAG